MKFSTLVALALSAAVGGLVWSTRRDPDKPQPQTTDWFSRRPNDVAIPLSNLRAVPGLPSAAFDPLQGWIGPENTGYVLLRVSRYLPDALEGTIVAHHPGGIALGPPFWLQRPVGPIAVPRTRNSGLP